MFNFPQFLLVLDFIYQETTEKRREEFKLRSTQIPQP